MPQKALTTNLVNSTCLISADGGHSYKKTPSKLLLLSVEFRKDAFGQFVTLLVSKKAEKHG